jgi:hypothetical protein
MNTDDEKIKVGDTIIWRDGGGEKRKVTALSPDGRLFQTEAQRLATTDGRLSWTSAIGRAGLAAPVLDNRSRAANRAAFMGLWRPPRHMPLGVGGWV